MIEILVAIFTYFTAQFGADYLNDKIKENKELKKQQKEKQIKKNECN